MIAVLQELKTLVERDVVARSGLNVGEQQFKTSLKSEHAFFKDAVECGIAFGIPGSHRAI